MFQRPPDSPDWIISFIATVSLGAVPALVNSRGAPEEVAATVAWLASEDAAFITGQVFTVDGCRTAQLSLP